MTFDPDIYRAAELLIRRFDQLPGSIVLVARHLAPTLKGRALAAGLDRDWFAQVVAVGEPNAF